MEMENVMELVNANFVSMKSVLEEFSIEDNLAKIAAAGNLMSEALSDGGKIVSCGNGGSLCDATHFAEELTARFRKNREALAAVAINDPAFITCVANDFGYDYTVSRFVEAFGKPGDVLLAISTSGNSKNIVIGAKAAYERGMKVVSLTGKDGGELAAFSDIEIKAPFTEYSDRAQEIHIKVIHTLVQIIENELGLDK